MDMNLDGATAPTNPSVIRSEGRERHTFARATTVDFI